jgi:hypothetical protein
MVAAVLSSFLPSALLTAATAPSRAISSLAAEEPPTTPTGCFIVSCNKGAPTAPTPTLTLAALSAMAVAAAAIAMATRRNSRLRRAITRLPRGSVRPPYHPPQFS